MTAVISDTKKFPPFDKKVGGAEILYIETARFIIPLRVLFNTIRPFLVSVIYVKEFSGSADTLSAKVTITWQKVLVKYIFRQNGKIFM